jgi:quercetin dioxygenase-like cupin family protein
MKPSRLKPILPLLFIIVFFGFSGAYASDYEGGVKVSLIKQSTTAANGQKLAYAKTDNPEVTAMMVEIPAGGDTGWHTHPFPVYAYVLSGAITVALEDGQQFDFKEGEVILEVIDTPHIGKTKGTVPLKLIVFYTGAQGSQNTAKVVK